MSFDLTGIMAALDYYIRKLHALLNTILAKFGAAELTSSDVEFSTKHTLW